MKKKRGFTLIETLVVVLIIGILANYSFAKIIGAIEKAKVARAVSDITTLKNAMILFKLDNNKLPNSSLDELIPDYLPKIPIDPWDNEYKYYNHSTKKGNGKRRMDGPIVPINSEYDIYSEGKDGKSTPSLRSQPAQDDVVLGNDGGFIGLGKDY